MIRINYDPVTKQNMTKLLQCFYYTQELLLSHGVILLCTIQFSAKECNWECVLRHYPTQLVVARVGMNLKRFAKIWVHQKGFSCHYFFNFLEGVNCYLYRLPSLMWIDNNDGPQLYGLTNYQVVCYQQYLLNVLTVIQIIPSQSI